MVNHQPSLARFALIRPEIDSSFGTYIIGKLSDRQYTKASVINFVVLELRTIIRSVVLLPSTICPSLQLIARYQWVQCPLWGF